MTTDIVTMNDAPTTAANAYTTTYIATATYLYADGTPLTVAVRVTSRAKTQAGIARAVAARLAKTNAALCGLRLDRVEVAS